MKKHVGAGVAILVEILQVRLGACKLKVRLLR